MFDMGAACMTYVCVAYYVGSGCALRTLFSVGVNFLNPSANHTPHLLMKFDTLDLFLNGEIEF